ncbi:MAG: hypothetical protein IPM96_16020 [Ignavibacteria bacterium]|nr:hypothetical protein [Ignavibacteria bacterium]
MKLDASTFTRTYFIKQEKEKKPVCIINCDTWRIVRPATEDDKIKARYRILKRLRDAFWL